MTESKKKVKVLGAAQCPYCEKVIIISVETQILTPAEPAQRKVVLKLDKECQTTL